MGKGIMTQWDSPAELQRDHDTARRLLLDQGIVLSDDPAAWAKLRDVFTSIFLVLHREIMQRGTLSFVYTFDQNQQQQPKFARLDGYASVSERLTDGRRVSYIGIAVQTLCYSRDYSIMVLLHELTHTLSGFPSEHGPEFHAYLDGLIARFNAATGASVKNDYYGLP